MTCSQNSKCSEAPRKKMTSSRPRHRRHARVTTEAAHVTGADDAAAVAMVDDPGQGHATDAGGAHVIAGGHALDRGRGHVTGGGEGHVIEGRGRAVWREDSSDGNRLKCRWSPTSERYVCLFFLITLKTEFTVDKLEFFLCQFLNVSKSHFFSFFFCLYLFFDYFA